MFYLAFLGVLGGFAGFYRYSMPNLDNYGLL